MAIFRYTVDHPIEMCPFNLTDIKQTEEALYRKLIFSIASISWTTDYRGRYFEPIADWENYTGQSTEEAMGYGWLDMIPETDREIVKKGVLKHTQNPHPYSYTLRVYNQKTETYHKCLIYTIPIFDENGNIEKWIGANIDVEEIKHREQDLIASEQRFKMLSESTDEAIIVHQNGNVKEINKAFTQIFGFNESEIFDAGLFVLAASDYDRKIIIKHLKEEDEVPVIMQFKSKAGDILDIRVASKDITYEGEQARVCVIRDITNDIKSQGKLRESEERFKLLSEASDEAITIHLNGYIKEINKTFTDLLGYKKDEAVGMHIFDFAATEGDQKIMVNRLKKGDESPIMVKLKTKSGDIKQFRAIPKDIIYEGLHSRVVVLRDLTQEIETQKLIRESEERFKQLVDQAPYAIEVYNAEGYLIANNNAQKIFWEFTKNRQRTKYNILKDENNYLLPYVKKAFKGEIADVPEFYYQKGENQESEKLRWLRPTLYPIKTNDGVVINVVVMYSDETEKHSAKMQLEESQERLGLSVMAAKMGTYDYLIENEKLILNARMYEIFDIKKDKHQDETLYLINIFHPKDRDRVISQFRIALKESDQFTYDYRVILEKERVKHIHARAIIIRDDKQKAIRIVGTCIDVTKQKEAEIHLKENAILIEKAQELANMGIWRLNINTNKMSWSKQLYQIFGETKDSLKPTLDNYLKKVYQSDRTVVKNTILNSLKTLKPFNIEERITTPSGEIRYLTTWGRITANKLGNLVEMVGVSLDITERKKAEQNILSSFIKGEDKERLRIARELHDGLGQNLTAANLNLNALNDSIKQQDDKQKKQLNLALNLLQTAMEESRNIAHNLMPKVISDFGLIPSLKSLFNNINKSEKLKVEFSYKLDDVLLLKNMEVNLYRIAQEALNNVIKHANAKRVDVHLRVKENHLIFTMEDDGNGFEMSKLTAANKGIGISNIESRVYSMNGTIDIDSKLNKGTFILIEIPLDKLADNE